MQLRSAPNRLHHLNSARSLLWIAIVFMQRAVQQELKAAGLMASEDNPDTRKLEWAGEQQLQQHKLCFFCTAFQPSAEAFLQFGPPWQAPLTSDWTQHIHIVVLG